MFRELDWSLLVFLANLIVAETAARHGVTLTFREYARAGVPVTILALLVGIAWLARTP